MRKIIKLVESITNDFAVNAEIEQGLKQFAHGNQTMIRDGLEVIYNAGAEGISVSDWMSHMLTMYPGEKDNLKDMFRLMVNGFPQFIKHTGEKYVFHAMTAQADAPVDDQSPLGRAAADQIRLTGRILEICKQLGRFTAHDVLNAIAAVTAYSPAILRELVDHVLNSNSGVIKLEGQGIYRYEEPMAKSGMGFWRDLEGYQPPKD